jgi:hypothetical protein
MEYSKNDLFYGVCESKHIQWIIFKFLNFQEKLNLLESKFYTSNDKILIGMNIYTEYFNHNYFTENELELIFSSCNTFAFYGCLYLLEYAQTQLNVLCDRHTTLKAIEGGHLNVLEYLITNGYPWNELALIVATRNRHLEILKWAVPSRFSFDPQITLIAIKEGNLDILKWAIEQGIELNEKLCNLAAETGNLNILIFLRSLNPPCPWNSETCTKAVCQKRLDILIWLRSQNPPCPWDENTCYKAAKKGYLSIYFWLRSQNPPCPTNNNRCSGALMEWLQYFAMNPDACDHHEEPTKEQLERYFGSSLIHRR